MELNEGDTRHSNSYDTEVDHVHSNAGLDRDTVLLE